MFGHTFELIIVLLVGLLIFGPKRVIEMGAAAGRMLRELRDAMKEMNWSALSGEEYGSGSDPLAELRDLPRNFASSILNPPPVTAEPPATSAPASASASATTATSQEVVTPAETRAAPAPTMVESAPPHSQNGSAPSASGDVAVPPSTSASSSGGAPAEPVE